eukprot:g9630.t1
MDKGDNSPHCDTDHATMEVVDTEGGKAGAAQSCLTGEWRQEFAGEGDENHRLVLPKDPRCLEKRIRRSSSRTRQSVPPNRRYSMNWSTSPEPKARLVHAGGKDDKAAQSAQRMTTPESCRQEGNVREWEEPADKADSETGDMAGFDKQEGRDALLRTAKRGANAVGGPATRSTSAANCEWKQAVQPATVATPVLQPLPAPAPVPTIHSLRMFLGVLKHNPVGLIREVGVLLMLHVLSTEVAVAARAAAAAAAAEPPSAVLSNDGRDAGGREGRRLPRRTEIRRESAHQKRRAEEAVAVLALALSAEKGTIGRSAAAAAAAAGGATAARATKHRTRFRHQLRQPAKVEDKLQAWAATRGRELATLKAILELSVGGQLVAGSAGARLVRDRARRINVGQATKDCARATGSIGAADTSVGPDRMSIVQDDSHISGGKDEPSEMGERSHRSPSDPVIWESSTSNSPGGSDCRIEGSSPDSCSRLESSMEQGLVKMGGGVVFLSPSSSDGDGSTILAATIAAEENASGLLCCSDARSAPDHAIAADGTAEEELTDENRVSSPSSGNNALVSPNRSSDGAPVVIWQTSSSEVESEQQYDPAGNPGDIGGATDDAMEARPLDLRTPSMWPADPLDKNRDPLGDLSLVSKDGTRNEWDDILDEQLSKCPPVQPCATRRTTSSAHADGDRSSMTITSDGTVLATRGCVEEVVQSVEGGKKEEFAEQEPNEDERAGRDGVDGEGFEEGDREEGLRDPSSGSLGCDSTVQKEDREGEGAEEAPQEQQGPREQQVPRRRQQQQQQQKKEEGEGEHEDEQGQTAISLSLAPEYAYLLNQACGSMLDVVQGSSVDSPVVRAVGRAAAAARTAHFAVTEALGLLDNHLSGLLGGTKVKVRRPASSSSTSCEVTAEPSRRDGRPVETGPGRRRWRLCPAGGVNNEVPVSAAGDASEDQEGGRIGEKNEAEESGSPTDNGRTSGGKRPGEVDEWETARGAVDEGVQEGKEGADKSNEAETGLATFTGHPWSAQRKADIYWAEVAAGATAGVAAELGERAKSAAAAYERTRDAGHGGLCDGEAGHAGGQRLHQQGGRDYEAWLESRLAAVVAAAASKTAVAMARRVAMLTTAPTPAQAFAREGAAGARQGVGRSWLTHEGGVGGGGGGEGGREHPPGRPQGGNSGIRQKNLSSTEHDVDVGAWNGGVVGRGHEAYVLRNEGQGRQAAGGRVFSGKRGVFSLGRRSAGVGSAGSGTAATLRCGKPWGSVAAESTLSVQWYVEKNPGNIGGPLDQLRHRLERRAERRERRRRAPEMEVLRNKKLAERERNGGVCPRSGLMGNSWPFPGGKLNPSPCVPPPASLSRRSTTSSSPPSTSWNSTGASPEGSGHTEDEPGSFRKPRSTSTVEDTASTVYRLSSEHTEMTKRWPAGLLGASKALIAEVPGLEEHERRTFEAALERSVRRGVMGHTRWEKPV